MEVSDSGALALLDTMEDGQFRVALDDSLTEFVRSLNKHFQSSSRKAKGVLTIRIAAIHDGQHVILQGQVETKLPKPIRGETIMFRTPDNGLSTQHPKQLNLPFVDPSKNGEPSAMRVI